MMSYPLMYLAQLVQIKNSLNRKRRRFLALARPIPKFSYNPGSIRYVRTPVEPHKSFPFAYAETMYKQTQAEMKAMTAHMREVQKQANARLGWNSSGGIKSIYCGDKRYDVNDIARFADAHLVDSILLK